MKTRKMGDQQLVVPDLDPRDLDSHVEAPRDDLLEAAVESVNWSNVSLDGIRIRLSSFKDVTLGESAWSGVRLSGCRLERVDLSGARLSGLTIERCEFIDCRLTGLHLSDTTLTNVIFERCGLDYAILDEVRATGPVAWVDCNLNEASFTTCQLGMATLIDNSLRRLELTSCDLRGADLRQNDIRELVGLTSLGGARLSIDQLPALADLAVRDLGIEVASA